MLVVLRFGHRSDLLSLKTFLREPPLQLVVGIPTLHGSERRGVEGLGGQRHRSRQGSAEPLRIAAVDMGPRGHCEIGVWQAELKRLKHALKIGIRRRFCESAIGSLGLGLFFGGVGGSMSEDGEDTFTMITVVAVYAAFCVAALLWLA